MQPISERKNLEKTGIKINKNTLALIELPGGGQLDCSLPLVMSIVNCTPDSFYKESRTLRPEEAAEKALAAQYEGAAIIDFGAESTRPGSKLIDEVEEKRRLIPALKLFRRQSALPVSVDTRKAAIARLALDEGADIINDVSALSDPEMLPLCAEKKAAVIIMHGFDTHLHSSDVCPKAGANQAKQVRRFLLAAAKRAREGGIAKNRIILDPGFGFGKTSNDALLLLKCLETIARGDYPLLVGLSRKRFICGISGCDPKDALAGTIAANAIALINGANIIRVHDTASAVDTVKLVSAYRCVKRPMSMES